MNEQESELSKWRRLTNPQTVADYGVTVDVNALLRESPEAYQKEVAPYLPPTRK